MQCRRGVLAPLVVSGVFASICLGPALAESMEAVLLTSKERALAKEIGFDENALSIVKVVTKSPLEKFVINSEDNTTPTQAVKPFLMNVKEDSIEPRTEAQVKRMTELNRIFKKYHAYLQQEVDASPNPERAPFRGWFIDVRKFDGKSTEEVESQFKRQFEGKPLAEKYLPKPAVRFYLPMREFPISLPFEVVPYKRTSQISISGTPTSVIEGLQKQLKPLGYSASVSRSYKRTEVFSTLQEAEKFANELEIPQWQVRICKTPEFGFDVPPEMKQLLPGFIGAERDRKVEKINGKTRVTTPSRFSVDAELLTAILSKESGPGKVDKFDIVRFAGTNGNSSVSNKILLDRLAKWDSLYGIEVLEAKRDSVTVAFEKLPSDLSELCNEMWLLCPDILERSAGYSENASRLRNFATGLRSSKKVTLWWD